MRRHPHEPVEVDEPAVNVLLDQVEVLVDKILAEGGEAPLRARLARLLPGAVSGTGMDRP